MKPQDGARIIEARHAQIHRAELAAQESLGRAEDVDEEIREHNDNGRPWLVRNSNPSGGRMSNQAIRVGDMFAIVDPRSGSIEIRDLGGDGATSIRLDEHQFSTLVGFWRSATGREGA